MKIILLVLFLFISTVSLKSQLLQDFTASAGLDAAINNAINNDISNPKPIAILTPYGEFDLGLVQVQSGMKLNTGLSPLWIYVFESEGNFFGYVAFSVLGNYQFADFPEDELSSLPSTKPLDDEFIDSPRLAQVLSESTSFQGLLTKHNDAVPEAVALIKNEEIPELYIDEDYWIITYRLPELNQTIFSCLIHAITEETLCIEEEINSVELIPATNINIFPNPSSGEITFEANNNLQNSLLGATIYNSNSEVVFEFNDNSINNLNLNFLPNGTYFMIFDFGNKKSIKKFTIVK